MKTYLKLLGTTVLVLLFVGSAIRIFAETSNTSIATGDSTSGSSVTNVINTNDIKCGECVSPTEIPSPTPTTVEIPTPTPTIEVPTVSPTETPGGGQGGPPSCSDSAPDAPTGLTAIEGPGEGQVTLSWIAPSDPYTYFLIAYSDTSDAPKWGNPNIGTVTTFIVSGLPKGDLFFWVRAGNGCMPGAFAGPVKVTLAKGILGGVAQGFSQGVLGKGTMREEWNPKKEDIKVSVPTPEKIRTNVVLSNQNIFQLLISWIKNHIPFKK